MTVDTAVARLHTRRECVASMAIICVPSTLQLLLPSTHEESNVKGTNNEAEYVPSPLKLWSEMYRQLLL